MNISIMTLVKLSTQFSNIFQGARPASLTYEASYTGDDELFVKTYNENLVEDIATQADFWECVIYFKESFSVKVCIIGDHIEKEKLEVHLSKLVTEDLVKSVGRSPESSFF